jgi:pantoate kinase
LPVSEAFCPAGISSFFEICDTDNAGNLISDPTRIGARGGGFAINRGLTARVSVKKNPTTEVNIRINSKPAPHAHTTRWAVEELTKSKDLTLAVNVEVKVQTPMGAGFGTSAAGTLATCRALTDAADIPTTLNELGRITHIAEVMNRTGLGTASAILNGGFVLVTEPGAPTIGLVDNLFFPENHSIICAYLGPMPTREILSKLGKAYKLNEAARRTMEAIRRTPNLATFLAEARRFGAAAGFETARVSRLITAMLSAGAVGAAQNMIGEAVHSVAADSRVTKIIGAVRKQVPEADVFASRLDDRGVRLVKKNPKH